MIIKVVSKLFLLISLIAVLPVTQADDTDIYLTSELCRENPSYVTAVAASAPLNVYNTTHSLNDLFLTVSEVGCTEKWHGNIKKLKLIDIKGNGGAEILDVRNLALARSGKPYSSAISSVDGRIQRDALTFWTIPGMLPPADSEKNEVNGKDGRSVMRGGAGQLIPGYLRNSISYSNVSSSRQIYTENSSGTGLMTFDAQ